MILPGFRSRCVIPDSCVATKRIGDLGGVPEDVGRGQWTSREAHGKGLPLEVLHDKKPGLAVLPDVVQHADVRMATAATACASSSKRFRRNGSSAR